MEANPLRPIAEATPSRADQILRLRIQAIVHDCLHRSATKLADAQETDDEEEALTLRREAAVYHECSNNLNRLLTSPLPAGTGQ